MRVSYHQEAALCDPNPYTVYGMRHATAGHIYPVKSDRGAHGIPWIDTYFYFISAYNEMGLVFVSQPECLHLCPLSKSPLLWAW